MSRRVLITGAGSGIGFATALCFAEQGAELVLVGRSEPSLGVAAEALGRAGGRPQAICADVTDSDALAEALAAVAALDVVVVNAGTCQRARLDAPQAVDVWRDVMAVNLDGAFHTLRILADRIVEGGRVVAVSSGLGKQGRADYAAYTASKHGLIGLVRALAKEWAPRGITANAVCPGWVDTAMAREDLARNAAASGASPRDARREAEAAIPLGRFVTADEVAAMIAWLASPAAGAITGQAMNISGGEVSA